jgi:hypothetical protein
MTPGRFCFKVRLSFGLKKRRNLMQSEKLSTSNTYRKRLTLQGFGFSFLLASLLFLITDQWLSFGVIVPGLLLGFGLGTLLDQRRSISHLAENRKIAHQADGRFATWLCNLYLNNSLPVRFASLLVLGALLLILAWYAGYYLLPEQIIQTSAPAGKAAAQNIYWEWARILGYNLLVLVAIALIGLLLPSHPFAYLVPLAWCILYGLLLGTNSFVIPMPERLAPTLEVFQRAGPFELAAYLLVAASAYSPARRTLIGLKATLSRRLDRSQFVGLALGILLLILASGWEAHMILAAAN